MTGLKRQIDLLQKRGVITDCNLCNQNSIGAIGDQHPTIYGCVNHPRAITIGDVQIREANPPGARRTNCECDVD